MVELHWKLVPRYLSFDLPFTILRERATTITLASKEIPTLCDEDALLVLCVHGAKHLWGRLQWVCDIAEFIRAKPDLDRDALMNRARSLGAERIVCLGMNLAEELLGAPGGVRRDAQVRSLSRKVRDRLRGGGKARAEGLERALFFLRMRERARDKMRTGLMLLASPTVGDRMTTELPAILQPLYLLVRPVRLVRQFTPGALKMARGRWGR
jgi:hypothetical protein